MSGKVAADLSLRGDGADIEPGGCPGADLWEERTGLSTPVACWRRSDLFGERRCRYLEYTAQDADMTRRYSSAAHLEEMVRDQGRLRKRVCVMCGIKDDVNQVPGA